MHMNTIQSFMEHQLASGQYFFTKELAQATLNLSDNAFHLQIKRSYKKGNVVLLGHGFYVIVAAEYRHYGCIPTHWIIDPYFHHIQKNYYVGLLSAATFYGATQQQPMVFQVMVDQVRRPIFLPKETRMVFHLQQHLQQAKVQEVKTPTGYTRFSTREQTIVDLISFHKQAGYLNNVAIIIRDLLDDIHPENMTEVLNLVKETTILQRLGYIWDMLGASHLSLLVQSTLQNRKVFRTLLRPEVPCKQGPLDDKWCLTINDTLELDA